MSAERASENGETDTVNTLTHGPSATSRVLGCWLGKSIGGTLGLPAEGLTGRLEYTFYDPVPTSAPPNDDLELQLVWLHMVEQLGPGAQLTREEFAQAWLTHIHYMWDEYGICRWNLRRGVPAAACGTFENWFASGMGSPIRSEFWACLFPGDPVGAAHYAGLDASLDHGREGIAGEVYLAVLQSLLLGGESLAEALPQALAAIPDTSETARALRLVHAAYADGVDLWACRDQLLGHHRHENFTHAPLNLGLILWALLYGEGDFSQTILHAVNGGYDTDCTCATAGAVLGMLYGAEGIPEKWCEPIGNGVYLGPGILGIQAPGTLEELTERTLALRGKLALPPQASTASISDLTREQELAQPSLAELPGTIEMLPADNGAPVPWANGQLPTGVKAAGGATWTLRKTSAEPLALVALARQGMRLQIGEQFVHECPAGLPFVPAPHRCPTPATAVLDLPPGNYPVRLELFSREPAQEACLILTESNFHLIPWDGTELPHRPQLAPQTHKPS